MKKVFTVIKHLIPTTWYRKISKKSRFYLMTGVIAFFLIVIPAVFYTLSQSEKAEAAWFDGNWGYRQTINVTNGSGTNQTNTKLDGQANTTFGDITEEQLYIGAGHWEGGFGSWMNGQIDDFRIYNYALTPTQIKQVMNQGSAVRWGPATGTPN